MKLTIFIFLLFFFSEVQVQQKTSNQGNDTLTVSITKEGNNGTRVKNVFQKVEMGIKTGKINEYKSEIGNLVSITIGSNEHGYYSMNQAVSVLTDYFSARKSISFNFSKMQDTGTVPYATGRFVYLRKGVQESAQVYVSLTSQDSVWVINQFNIY